MATKLLSKPIGPPSPFPIAGVFVLAGGLDAFNITLEHSPVSSAWHLETGRQKSD